MAKGSLIQPHEKELILTLFEKLKSKREVARIVHRDPAAIRKITQPKPNPKIFNWKDFNNSII